MATERITNRQFTFILFMMRSTVAIATLPVLTTGRAAQDAWASASLALIFTSLITVIITGLAVRFPRFTLAQFTPKLIGKYIGGIMVLLFSWYFIHVASTDIRIYSEVLIGGFLPRAPLTFVVATMVSLTALSVYLGIETLGRISDALMPLFVIAVLVSVLGALPSFDLKNLEPVFAEGIGPIMSGAITPTAIASNLLIVPMLTPALTIPERSITSALLAMALSGAMVIIISIVVVGALGSVLASNSLFPFFKMTRSIEITEALERVEAFGILAWGFGLLVDVSVFLYGAVKGLAEILGLRDYRPLVGPVSVIMAILSVQAYSDIFEALRLFKPETVFPYVTALVFLPYLLLWGAYVIHALLQKLSR